MTTDSLRKYKDANPIILRYILESGIKNPKILDVGSWTGRLGVELKKNKFACEIDGVDINPRALKVARLKSGYGKTYLIDLNKSMLNKLPFGYYDLIIIGDVLEHLLSPEAAIKNLLPRIKNKGFFVVSLPNIGFIKYRILHLFGFWKYKEVGIMDKTHLRFFVLKSMKELFNKNNLKIIEFKHLNAVGNIWKPLDFLAQVWPELFGLQIVFKLKKTNNE